MIIFKIAELDSDFQEIERLAAIIWVEHYTPIIGKEQVAYMLQKFQSVKAIKEQINDGANYFLINYQDQNVGYFSFMLKTKSLFLSKLYVLNEFRAKCVGKNSIEFIERKAKELSCNTIALTVNKYNTNSIKAYEKMGFNIIDSVVNDIGNNFVMDDFVMEKSF